MRINGSRRHAAAAISAAITCLLGFALVGYLKPRPAGLAPVANSPQDLRLRLEGIEAPAVPVKMAAGTPTVIEIPDDDFFYVVHPGDDRLVTVDETSVHREEHFFVLRTGARFPAPGTASDPPALPAAPMTDEERVEYIREQINAYHRARAEARDAGRSAGNADFPPAPITQLTVQTTSGATFTISVSPANNPAEATRRVLVTYDREQIIEYRKASNLPVNLNEQRPRPEDEQ